MYKVIEEKGKLALKGSWGILTVHVVHCADNLKDLKEDVFNVYAVAEECTNYARIHLITHASADEALQEVVDYLREKEGEEEPHVIDFFECEL